MLKKGQNVDGRYDLAYDCDMILGQFMVTISPIVC